MGVGFAVASPLPLPLALPCTLFCCMFMRYAFFPRLTLTLAPNAHTHTQLAHTLTSTLSELYGELLAFDTVRRRRPCCCCRCPPCCFILAHLRHNGISFRCFFHGFPLTFPLSRLYAFYVASRLVCCCRLCCCCNFHCVYFRNLSESCFNLASPSFIVRPSCYCNCCALLLFLVIILCATLLLLFFYFSTLFVAYLI